MLGDFYHVFDDGLQLLILRSAELSQYNEAKKWYEWIEIAYEQTDQNHELFIEIHLHIKSFLNDLSDQISIIKQQEATLLETNIIYEKDIMALSTIKTACDALNLMYNTEGLTDEWIKATKTHIHLCRKLIEFAPSLNAINNLMIEPTLYKLMTEKNEESVDNKQSESSITLDGEIVRESIDRV